MRNHLNLLRGVRRGIIDSLFASALIIGFMEMVGRHGDQRIKLALLSLPSYCSAISPDELKKGADSDFIAWGIALIAFFSGLVYFVARNLNHPVAPITSQLKIVGYSDEKTELETLLDKCKLLHFNDKKWYTELEKAHECFISQELPRRPVILNIDTLSYNLDSIKKWFDLNPKRTPHKTPVDRPIELIRDRGKENTLIAALKPTIKAAEERIIAIQKIWRRKKPPLLASINIPSEEHRININADTKKNN